MKKFILTCCLALTLVSPLPSTEYSKRPNLHKQAFDASFALYGQEGDDVHFLCTATAYEKKPGLYHLITAGHCVTDEDVPDDIKFSVAKQVGGPRLPVTVLKAKHDKDIDFAVLELKSTSNYPLVELGATYTGEIGDRVFAPTFSEGLNEQISEGLIASTVMGTNVAPEDCAHCNGIVIAHLFGGPGMSGAVVISEKTHKVIGLVILRFRSNIGMGVETINGFRKFLHTD